MSMHPNEPKVDRTALIDGDILVYKAAAAAESHQLDKHDLLERIEFDVKDWTHRAFCSNAIICLSGPREANFRKEVYPLYKEHRPDERPAFHGVALEIIEGNHRIFRRETLEADDCLGLLATLRDDDDNPVVTNAVIISEDKDLRTVQGWHFNPNKDAKRGEDFPVYVTEEEAERAFTTQWMIGDSTDGYPGVYRFGEKGAAKLLDSLDPADWEAAALQKYACHAKEYTYEFCLQMARCARILTAYWWDTKTKTPILWEPAGASVIHVGLEEWAGLVVEEPVGA